MKFRLKQGKKTRPTKIGNLTIGGENPIAIQSMTTTKTEDWKSTVEQIHALEAEKCDIIRVAIPNMEAAKAIPQIKKHTTMPLVADIHFDHNLAIESFKQGADKIRINPGNIGSKDAVAEVIKAAKTLNKAIRIGINSGNMEDELLEKYGHPTAPAFVESALNSIEFCEKLGFKNIVVSLKSVEVPDSIEAYRLFAQKSDYPLHVGMTEAGTMIPGISKNAIGIGTLLQEGIGDTIRVSMTESPVDQVKTAKEILKCLHLYDKEPTIISCPTCGRTEIDVKKLSQEVTRRTAHIQKPLKITVLGCAVNGPGEAKEADYGIAGGRKKGVIYRKGEIYKVVQEAQLLDEFIKLIESENA
ncbi:flavodoxin-dependent (E)-4-hydroxy-3-methylbut-2-enyl-diphosphate synthase [Patescibacteria group bacterium]